MKERGQAADASTRDALRLKKRVTGETVAPLWGVFLVALKHFWSYYCSCLVADCLILPLARVCSEKQTGKRRIDLAKDVRDLSLPDHLLRPLPPSNTSH